MSSEIPEVEKLIKGKPEVQSNLEVRGNKKAAEDRRINYLTTNNVNVGMFFHVAVFRGGNIKTDNIKRGFVQGAYLD